MSASTAATLKGGLCGCGMISEYHLEGWRRIPSVEIAALADRTVEKAEARRDAYVPEARVYEDLGAMLDAEDLDFVDILTPPALHYEHCLEAKKAGVHIICQKPICARLEEARTLVAAMEDSPKLFAIHENHRYRPWFQAILERVRAGFFGEIAFVRLEQFDPAAPPERYKLDAERGVLLEYGTHLVDMARCLLGEPERAYARTRHAHPSVRGESLVHLTYEYPAATAVIDIGWKPAGLAQGSVLVHGPRGEAYYEGTMTRGMTRGEQSRFRLVKGSRTVLDETRSPLEDYAESFYRFEQACAAAMLKGTPVEQTGAENLRTLEATFAGYAAAERGAPVSLSNALRLEASGGS